MTIELLKKLETFLEALSGSKVYVSGTVAVAIGDVRGFIPMEPVHESGGSFCVGTFGDTQFMVDPHMKWGDMRVLGLNGELIADLSSIATVQDLI